MNITDAITRKDIRAEFAGRGASILQRQYRELKEGLGKRLRYPYRPWTVEERQEVNKQKTEGRSIKDIASATCRSICAIHQYFQRNRSDRRVAAQPWTNEDDATLMRLRADGVKFSRIAEVLVVPRTLTALYARYSHLKGLGQRGIIGGGSRGNGEQARKIGSVALGSDGGRRGYATGPATRRTERSSSSRRSWTQEELDTLQRMKENGYSNAEIALELERTPKGVARRWQNLLGGRTTSSMRFSAAEDAKLLELRASGMNW